MPKLEEAKRLHRELADTMEIFKSLRDQIGAVLGNTGESIAVANLMDNVDSHLRQIQGELQKVVGREVMR